ncbi:YqzH family protein [Bacillus sp. REN10]|uniref:YqzH family protein n=1 Tax=Bacillus sp. REN10 TaxID=2782541 RepID=UPI00193B1351|nr:YqzH family protein [Bacillus sp. REN10]
MDGQSLGCPFFTITELLEEIGLPHIFIQKRIEQSLANYDYELDWQEDEEVLLDLIHRIKQRCSGGEEELYEVIEDEIYSFVTGNNE